MTKPLRLRDIAGINLRRIREDRGLSQRELAERMEGLGYGWSATSVADTEQARRGLNIDELIPLGLILQVSPLTLLSAEVTVFAGVNVVDDPYDPGAEREFRQIEMDPGLFNLWLRAEARLWFDGRELVVLVRPDVLTTDELAEKHPELFLSTDDYEESRRRRKEGK